VERKVFLLDFTSVACFYLFIFEVLALVLGGMFLAVRCI
jgi:hypothetical protein